jgi:hypothetical protein
MELLCPHCLKKVSVSDDKAGTVLNCPLCQGVFAAPSLPPSQQRMPAAPPPPPPPVSDYQSTPVGGGYASSPAMTASPSVPNMELPPRSVTPEPLPFAVAPAAPPPTPLSAPPPVSPAPQPSAPPPPPKPAPPLADYTKRYAFRLRADVLVCIPPVCIFLIVFVLSFFPWHIPGPSESANLWQLGFTERYYSGMLMGYVLFMILALPVAMASAALELGLAPRLPQLEQLLPWKSGLTLAALAITFLFICYDYQSSIFGNALFGNAEKLAFRLHFLALVCVCLELWVQSRRVRNLPLPRFTLKL